MRRATWLVLVSAIACVAIGLAAFWPQPDTKDRGGPAATEPAGDSRKVFAHYFPPYPISIDNEPAAIDYYSVNYLTVDGEGGKHAAYGGLLRDRPLGRQPISSPDWRVQDLRTEVLQAKAAGIDGFTVNILGLSGMNWTATINLMRAAADVGGFTVVPNVDATAGIASETPAAVASGLAQLYKYSSADMVDGEYLLSSFAAERRSPDWWQRVIDSLEREHGVPIKFVAVFLDASESNMQSFAPISHGFGNWGLRAVDNLIRAPNYAAAAHSMNRIWMEPVAFQDARPRSGVYAEAGNTETGRAAWAKASADQADLVQIVTWNDYSESTQIAPSEAHGSVLLELSARYIRAFKDGKEAEPSADHLYLTHRIHPHGARATSGINGMSNTLGGASTPPRDTVEALVLLTSPARVTVTSGGNTSMFEAPAGVTAFTVPLGSGVVSGTIVRDATVALSVVSPHIVTTTPVVQDFQYFAAGR